MTTIDDPLPDLIRALRSPAPADRVRAAKDLGRLGWLARDALPALVGALRDAEGKVREAAAHAVGQMGPEALPALTGMLGHEDKYVRRNAVWAIGKLGPLGRPALAPLCLVLKDQDPRTASGAAQGLGNMGAVAADAIPQLAEAMRGTNIVLCRLAAKALSQIGPPALPTLISHLQHPDPFVRGESALALGWMGAAAKSAVPYLVNLVRGPRTPSLGDTPPPCGGLSRASVSPDQLEDSDDGHDYEAGTKTPTVPSPDEALPEETSRAYAAQALGRMGPAAAAALGELRAVARYGTDTLRQAARQAIRLILEA